MSYGQCRQAARVSAGPDIARLSLDQLVAEGKRLAAALESEKALLAEGSLGTEGPNSRSNRIARMSKSLGRMRAEYRRRTT